MSGKKYTPLEDKILRENYPTLTSQKVSTMINRTIFSISHRAERLGIKKDKEFFKKDGEVIKIYVTQTFHIYESKLNSMD